MVLAGTYKVSGLPYWNRGLYFVTDPGEIPNRSWKRFEKREASINGNTSVYLGGPMTVTQSVSKQLIAQSANEGDVHFGELNLKRMVKKPFIVPVK